MLRRASAPLCRGLAPQLSQCLRKQLLCPETSLSGWKGRRSAPAQALRVRLLCRQKHAQAAANESSRQDMNSRVAYYFGAVAVCVFGLAYASVPLYKVFCQMTGFGGTTQRATESKASTVKPVEGGKIIRVDFCASVHSAMPWIFKPTQRDVRVVPGETALAFYTVKNTSDKAITGVATYNVFPPKAGLYFNKIQCFCFEEQRLGPGEEIDMPVFFFLDPELVDDPAMESVNNITLSYTFFKTGEE